MASAQQTKPPAAVVDACWIIGLCAKEAKKYPAAKARLDEYARDGWELYAPGVMMGEVLFALCKKLTDGVIDSADYSTAISAFVALSTAIKPPPNGDLSLISRANVIRGAYGCSKSADSIYLALAEELKADRQTELVTFDAKIENHAKASSLDGILKILPVAP